MKNFFLVLLFSLYAITLHSQESTIIRHELELEPILKSHIEKHSGLSSDKKVMATAGQNYGDPPDFPWIRELNKSASDKALDLISDSEGNIYICGEFSGELDFFGQQVKTFSKNEGFIAKMDTDGQLLWKKQIAGKTEQSDVVVSDITVDDSDNIFITGYFSRADIVIGDSEHLLKGEVDLFAARMDKTGNFIWSMTYGKEKSYERGLEIANRDSQLFILTDLGLLIADKEGNIGKFHSSLSRPNSIAFTASEIIVSGSFLGSAYLNMADTILKTEPGYRGSNYLARLNRTADSLIDIKVFPYRLESSLGNIIINNEGEIYLSGYMLDEIKLDDENFIENPDFTERSLILKLMPDFTVAGYKLPESSNNRIHCMLRSNDTVYISGIYEETLAFEGRNVSGENQFLLKMNLQGDILGLGNMDFNATNMIVHEETIYGIENSTDVWDVRCAKASLSGDLLWEKESSGDGGYAGINYTIDSDEEQNIYIHGEFEGKILEGESAQEGKGIYVAKISPEGNPIWTQGFQANAAYGSGIKTDLNGNVYACGFFTGDLHVQDTTISNNNGESMYIIKLNNDGNLLYLKSFEGTGRVRSFGGIEIDQLNDLLISGVFESELSIGNETFRSAIGYDGFLIKMGSEANVKWAKHYSTEGTTYSRSVAVDDQNNVYLTGGFGGSSLWIEDIELVPDSILLGGSYHKSSQNVFIAKYDPEGKALWAKKAGNGNYYSRGHTIKVSAEGDAYVSGIMWNLYDLDDKILFGDIQLNGNLDNHDDMFLAKYNSAGEVQWANLIEINRHSWPAYQLGMDESENIYVGGQFGDTLVIDNQLTHPAHLGTTDLFLAKYNLDGNLLWLKTIENEDKNLGSILTGLEVLREDHLILGGELAQSSTHFDEQTIHSAGVKGFLACLAHIGINLPPNQTESNIIIYPNPVKDMLKVSIDRRSDITIYSLKGKILLRKSCEPGENIINTAFMQKGIYIIKVENESNTHSEKIMAL